MCIENLVRLRQAAYRLFGALFIYPDEGRLTELIGAAGELENENHLFEDFPFSGSWQKFISTLVNLTDEKKDEVGEEFVPLFHVKPLAPPYESVYTDPERRNTGWIIVQLEKEYADKGLVLEPSLGELPDHISIELEFMSYLCGLEFSIYEDEDDDSQARKTILKQQHDFLNQHLSNWFSLFAAKVREAYPEGFYSILVDAAEEFIKHELVFIPQLLEEV